MNRAAGIAKRPGHCIRNIVLIAGVLRRGKNRDAGAFESACDSGNLRGRFAIGFGATLRLRNCNQGQTAQDRKHASHI